MNKESKTVERGVVNVKVSALGENPWEIFTIVFPPLYSQGLHLMRKWDECKGEFQYTTNTLYIDYANNNLLNICNNLCDKDHKDPEETLRRIIKEELGELNFEIGEILNNESNSIIFIDCWPSHPPMMWLCKVAPNDTGIGFQHMTDEEIFPELYGD